MSDTLIRTAKIRDDEIDISSLAEGERAHLYARTWDAVGYWRWLPTKNGRRCKAFFTFSRTGIPQRVLGYDTPERARLLKPITRGTPPAKPMAAEAEPQDMLGALAAFEARLLLAIRVDAAEPDPERRLLRVKTTNYQTSAEPGDYPTGITTRFQPTREQRDDAAIVLKWLAGLESKPFTALWLKAIGFSTKSIAERMKTNAAKVRFHVKRAVSECWRASQGHASHRSRRTARRRR